MPIEHSCTAVCHGGMRTSASAYFCTWPLGSFRASSLALITATAAVSALRGSHELCGKDCRGDTCVLLFVVIVRLLLLLGCLCGI